MNLLNDAGNWMKEHPHLTMGGVGLLGALAGRNAPASYDMSGKMIEGMQSGTKRGQEQQKINILKQEKALKQQKQQQTQAVFSSLIKMWKHLSDKRDVDPTELMVTIHGICTLKGPNLSQKERSAITKTFTDNISKFKDIAKSQLSPEERDRKVLKSTIRQRGGIPEGDVVPQGGLLSQLRGRAIPPEQMTQAGGFQSFWPQPAPEGMIRKGTGELITQPKTQGEWGPLTEGPQGGFTQEGPQKQVVRRIAPEKPGKLKYDTKSITDYYEKNVYDEDGAYVGLTSEQVTAIKDMIAKSDSELELVEETMPAQKSWFGDVGKPNIPESKKWVLRKKTKPVSLLKYKTAEDVKVAYSANEITKEEALRILKKRFKMQ